MKHLYPRDPRTPPFCLVPLPYHFHVRTDLLEELCLSDAYGQFLPRNDEAYRRWLSCVGRTADEMSLDYVAYNVVGLVRGVATHHRADGTEDVRKLW